MQILEAGYWLAFHIYLIGVIKWQNNVTNNKVPHRFLPQGWYRGGATATRSRSPARPSRPSSTTIRIEPGSRVSILIIIIIIMGLESVSASEDVIGDLNTGKHCPSVLL